MFGELAENSRGYGSGTYAVATHGGDTCAEKT